MNQINTPIESISPATTAMGINGLTETFSKTHQPKDLKALLTCICDHYSVASRITFHKFLYSVQKKTYIKQKALTDLLYQFSLLMISQMEKEEKGDWSSSPLLQETKSCVGIMLNIASVYQVSHHRFLQKKILLSQPFWDHLYWQVFLMNPVCRPVKRDILLFRMLYEFFEQSSKEIDRPALFLKLFIVHLGIFLQYRKFSIEMNVARNKFIIHQIYTYRDFPYSAFIRSEQINSLIRQIPPSVNSEDLMLLASLFDPEIYFQKFGHPVKVRMPTHHLCWKIIQHILDSDLVPVILQNQQNRINEIAGLLSILPLVLILLIWEYYNDIGFLQVQTAPIAQTDPQVSKLAIQLFYHPNRDLLKQTDEAKQHLQPPVEPFKNGSIPIFGAKK